MTGIKKEIIHLGYKVPLCNAKKWPNPLKETRKKSVKLIKSNTLETVLSDNQCVRFGKESSDT